MTEPRSSPLHDRHTALGAGFTDFGGWLMPVRYSSDLAEHHAVRTAAGLFDISHMGEVFIEGPDAGELLDYALAGRFTAMPVGKAKYTLLLDTHGGIMDDLIVYRLEPDRYLVIANAGNAGVVADALRSRGETFASRVLDVSEDYALIALQGPHARTILEQSAVGSFERPLAEVAYYAAVTAVYGGETLVIARTGYTGEDGYELLVPRHAVGLLWDALLTTGAPLGLVPAGLAARDTLRLEAGMPLYGHELTTEIAPAQAGLARTIPADKPRDSFVGGAGLVRENDTPPPILVGLRGEGRRAARAGYPVCADDGDAATHPVGIVTSGALSPTLGYPIAMAYVAPEHAAVGTELLLDVRGKMIAATVTELPFYRRKK